MSSVKPRIIEHDIVSLDVPVEVFPTGATGTVVSPCRKGTVLVEMDSDLPLLDRIVVARVDQLTVVTRAPA